MNFTGVTYNLHDEMLGYGEQLYAADAVGDPTMLHGSELDDADYASHSASGEFQETSTILMDGGDQYFVNAVHFDTIEELAWAGNAAGHVTSYYHAINPTKYTSFQVHMSEDIRDMYSIDAGVLCVTPSTLNLRSRYGLPHYTYRCVLPHYTYRCVLPHYTYRCVLPHYTYSSEKLENLQTLCYRPHNNRVLLGGHQPTVVEFDLETQQETSTFTLGSEDNPGDCVIVREHHRFVIHGERQGRIALHDPRSMREEHHFKPHSAALSDFDVQGYFIATCGYTVRMGREIEDQFLMVYDMRMMKTSTPLLCSVPPYLLRFVPGLSSCIAAVSISGSWNMLDIMQPETAVLMLHSHAKQNSMVVGSTITSMSIAPSSQAVLFGDTAGHIHLWTQGTKPTYNNFSRESPYPSNAEPAPSIPITDQYTPLGSLPLAIPHQPLLSDWPTHLMAVKYRPTPAVDPKILANMNMQGPVGYHSNTLGHNRNVVPYMTYRGRHKNSPENSSNCSSVNFKVPQHYRRIEIKYGKLGIDDFDFDYYNRTSFSGLDMSLPNSYCNSMLQIFFYLSPLRAGLLSHLCSREFCLACELGFLFHMLDISMKQGQPCNAANFLRAFRTIPEASAMSLTLSDSDTRAKVNLPSKIMSWNCFVLQQLKNELQCDLKEKAEAAGTPDEMPSNLIDDVFGSLVSRITRCSRCSHSSTVHTTVLLHSLSLQEIMPELRSKTEAEEPVEFSKVVEAGLCQGSSTQAWCEECNKYQPQQQLRSYQLLPNTLVINTGIDNPQDLSYWQEQYRLLLKKSCAPKSEKEGDGSVAAPSDAAQPTVPNSNVPVPGSVKMCRYRALCVRPDCKFWHPGRKNDRVAPPTYVPGSGDVLGLLENTMDISWVPPGLRARLSEDGSISVSNIEKDQMQEAADSDTEGIVYDLMGVVSLVTDPRLPDKNNLVATIKVGPSYHERSGASPVDNWYLFNDIGIVPITTQEALWFPVWKQPCVLYWTRRTVPPSLASLTPVCPITRTAFLSEKVTPAKRLTFVPLAEDELPVSGDLVAMDAEFVNLHQEEAEIRSDGTRTTIKPSHKAVARITCIRGQGPLEGTPFLDDYISTQEQVVDYLTQFSGIKPGDLDANYSQKHLTQLKSTYVKLRYLVSQGVKFVGHGLKNDFRVINMVVPPQQLLDTLHLFHMPHNRMLSLKFLAWYFLKIKIQSVTHDSIEDARTALALYKKYCELQANGTFREELEALYHAGKKAQWKVPGEDDEE
ncbi:PAB-dependent poly(A)-specific ribonuclease subunit PAN2 [Trinorchestia longiramus]|nr:PAB-dependent poly(A)-specific ribonuclease subunit PAN2 [Trinorchestia longiramus]